MDVGECGVPVNKQMQMIREFQRRGIDPSEPIDRKDWDTVRLSKGVRTKTEIVRDGVKQTRAKFEKSIGRNQVPDEVTIANLNKCRTNQCGSYGVLSNGDEVCWRCTCAGGRELFAKASSKREKCPLDPPMWDNTATLTVNGESHA